MLAYGNTLQSNHIPLFLCHQHLTCNQFDCLCDSGWGEILMKIFDVSLNMNFICERTNTFCYISKDFRIECSKSFTRNIMLSDQRFMDIIGDYNIKTYTVAQVNTLPHKHFSEEIWTVYYGCMWNVYSCSIRMAEMS